MTFRTPRLARSPGATFRATFAVLAVAAVVAAGCGSAGSKISSAIGGNVVTVDGTSISRHSFERDISALSSSSKLKALDKSVAAQATAGSPSQRLFDSTGHATRVLTTSWLNRLVNQIVVDHEFKALKLKVTASDTTEGQSQFAQLFATSSATGTALVAQFPKWFQTQEDAREARLVAVTAVLDAKHPVTQSEMLAFYQQNVSSLCPSGINVSHILLKTLPEANAVEAQLKAGAKFADVAKAKSIDTGSAKSGGALGCFATGEFVAPFEQATLKAKIGVPTAPVHSQFGYHVILTSKYVPPTFASLETQIRQELLQQLNLVQKFVAAGLKKAKVHIDPLYGTWDAKTSQVVAPKVPKARNSRNAPTTAAPAAPTTPTS